MKRLNRYILPQSLIVMKSKNFFMYRNQSNSTVISTLTDQNGGQSIATNQTVSCFLHTQVKQLKT